MMIMLLWILAAVLLVGVSAFSTSPIRKHRVSLFMALDLPKDILLKGKVQHGFGRGSKKLGFATANLPQFNSMLLANNIEKGVYCGFAKTMHYPQSYLCVSNLGLSPTFVGQENQYLVVETHLLDFETGEDLYDQTLTVCLSSYLREEKRFDSIQDLISQITNDISNAKSWAKQIGREKLEKIQEALSHNAAINDECFKLLP